MSETKTYVFPDGNGSGVDANLLAAMNGGFGGNNYMWVLFLALLFGWNGNGFAGNVGNAAGRDLLASALAGNGNSVSELATTLNCNVGQIQAAINAIGTQVQGVANSVGLTGQQVINSIQSGNAALASQMASCCCDIRNNITTQGYENRIANTEQTAILGGKIDAQTTLINDKFCQLEMREMQNKLDALRSENSDLKGSISNGQQTAAIQSFVASSINPIAAGLSALQSEVAGIKCKLPESVNVPYSPVVGIPSCAAFNMGLYGNGYGYGFNPYGNNPIWG